MSRSIGGFITGIDNPIGDTAASAIAGGYSQSQFNSNTLSSGDSDNYDLALYGGAKFGALGLRLGASYTWHDLSVNRSVAFQGFSNALSSSYDAGTTQVFAEAGYGITTPYADLEPFAGVAYVSLHTDAMGETGGAAALQSGSSTQDNTFTTLGLRAAKGFAVNGGTLTGLGEPRLAICLRRHHPGLDPVVRGGRFGVPRDRYPDRPQRRARRRRLRLHRDTERHRRPALCGQLAGSSQDNAIDGRVSIKF